MVEGPLSRGSVPVDEKAAYDTAGACAVVLDNSCDMAPRTRR